MTAVTIESILVLIISNLVHFDEFMNTVLEDVIKVCLKKNTRRKIGKIVLKGDSIALVCNISSE